VATSAATSPSLRYYGITRQSYYLWLRRYEQFGAEGLRDRSKRPLVNPNATKAAVVGKILYLRQHYHFGPAKIAMYLKRYHEVSVSPSGVWRILKRVDMNRLPTSQRYMRHRERWKRYEKPQPGHCVQLDVKFIEPMKGVRKKHYWFTAIDDCTRRRVLEIYERLNQKTAIQSSTTCSRSCPSKSSRSRPTTAPSSRPPSTGICSTAASGTSISDLRRLGSTARWSGRTASTTRSSSGCSPAWSSMTPALQRAAGRVGTLLTSSGHTAPWAV